MVKTQMSLIARLTLPKCGARSSFKRNGSRMDQEWMKERMTSAMLRHALGLLLVQCGSSVDHHNRPARADRATLLKHLLALASTVPTEVSHKGRSLTARLGVVGRSGHAQLPARGAS